MTGQTDTAEPVADANVQVGVHETLPLALFGTAALVRPAPTGALALELLSTYRTGQSAESAAEIVAHVPRSQRLFIVNAQRGALGALDILDPSTPVARNPVALGREGEVADSVDCTGAPL